MATDLSDGMIYFIESDAVDNQNWLHSPGNIDLDSFTEGTEYCKLQIPDQWIKECYTGIVPNTASSGSGFMFRSSRRFYQVKLSGIEAIGSEAHLIEKFFMDDRHVATSASTFTQYYVVICRDESTPDFEEFTDSTSTRRQYCTGIVTHFTITWNESENLRARIDIEFTSVW